VSPAEAVDSFGPACSTSVGDRARAFLKIQDGCDYNCSFCTIPLARGASRSQSSDVAVAQARELVAQGYKEVVLTGVNVGDYGKRSEGGLLSLLQRLAEVNGLERIRVSSIEPNLITDEMIEFVAASPKVCNHFHVPLQSGSDEILRGMRRRYATAYYRELIERIWTRIPGCGIGIDVIVGFPGETDAHFERTCTFLSELPFSYLHVFTYSERPNTPAAKFQNHVEPKVRYRRNEILRMLGKKKKHRFYRNMIGSIATVLFEGKTRGSMRFGFTENYVRVGAPLDSAGENELRSVRIVESQGNLCIGRPIHEEVAV
jgi:threonylcarbamoyladenosine tRNA methylthiotransferase MtaB